MRDTIASHGDAIFTGSPKLQVTQDHYYGGGGQIIPVYNARDAIAGIEQIIGQGEGIDGRIEDPDHVLFGQAIEYAHYFRYNEVLQRRRYQPNDSPQEPPTGAPVMADRQAVLNFRPNPKLRDYPVGSLRWNPTLAFNKIYMRLLNAIQVGCS